MNETEAYSLEAEQSVLGAILIDPRGALPLVLDTLAAGDFYLERHKLIYGEMLGMFERAQGVDFVTLAEGLGPGAPEGGWKAYLATLAQMVPTLANTRAYAAIVAGSARARRLSRALGEAAAVQLTAGNVAEVAERLAAAACECAAGRPGRGLRPIGEVALGWYDGLFKEESRAVRVDTGFKELDALLAGMWPGNLVLLAARPAVGKSAFAQCIAKNAARCGRAVAIFSCEMEAGEQLERLVAQESGIAMDALIDSATLSRRQADIDAVARGVDRLYGLPIYISDDASVTTAGIRAQCRMIKGLGLIVVDYLQLLRGERRGENRNAEVGGISRELKLIANDLKVPVLALSQLNRDVERRGSREPELSDLRDSGGLEQDGNKIIFMWQPDPERQVVSVGVKKNRRGRCGQVQFLFDGAHMSYTPLKRADYARAPAGAWESARSRKYGRAGEED